MNRQTIHNSAILKPQLQRNRAGYNSWCQMKTRCYNKNNHNYPYYGGRGIIVCDRWLNSFENFIADMGEPPQGTTLDRIDNDGNYEPSNCRWATPTEQSSNRRSNKVVFLNGKNMTLKQAAIMQGLKYKTVWQRINGYGWTVERALGI